MKHISVSKNWLFEIKAVRAIKTKKFGDAYSAIANISIVDGEVHVEGLLSRDKFTREDIEEIRAFVKSLGLVMSLQ
jgi:hypothetical protein